MNTAWLSRDGRLLFVAYGVRMFAYGFLSVVLGPYLAALGFGPATIGWIFTASLAGGALMTVGLTAVADRVGRRRVQVAGAVLMLLAALVFATTERLGLLVAAAILGAISPSGKDVGPFLALEQAMLPETTAASHRTRVFAAYNLVGALSGALGSLAAGLPAWLGLPSLDGYRALLWGYAAAALLLVGGGLKIVYDLWILALFRHIRPPEERAPAARARRSGGADGGRR